MDISFNGISASSLGLVSHGRSQILPQRNKSRISIAGKDGTFQFDDDTYTVRNIKCNFFLKKDTNAEFETAVSAISYWLTGDGYLILSDTTKRFDATVVSEIDWEQRNSTAGIFSVVFECQPWAEDVTVVSEAITGSAIDYGTKVKTFPQIVLAMTGNGTYIQASHVESGKYVRLTDTLTSGDEIIIDCATGKVTTNDVLKISKISIDTLFFPIIYGNNTITITTDGTATGNVVYRRRYTYA